jgi:hypothetical protein
LGISRRNDEKIQKKVKLLTYEWSMNLSLLGYLAE